MTNEKRNTLSSRIEELNLLTELKRYVPLRFYTDAQFMAIWNTLMVPKLDNEIDITLNLIIQEYAQTEKR